MNDHYIIFKSFKDEPFLVSYQEEQQIRVFLDFNTFHPCRKSEKLQYYLNDCHIHNIIKAEEKMRNKEYFVVILREDLPYLI